MLEQVARTAVIAATAFALWEVVKAIIAVELPLWAQKLIVLALTIYMSISTKTDMLVEFDLVLPNMLGYVFTGIIASKGANGVHDYASKIKEAISPKEEEVLNDSP